MSHPTRPTRRPALRAASLGTAGLLAVASVTVPRFVDAGEARAVTRGRADAGDCAALLRARIPDTTITGVEAVPAGTYQPAGAKKAFEGLPAFCRVTAIVRPAPDSTIGIELWLPAGWNGRYQQVGNHGWGGTIYHDEMAPQLRQGFAVAATDDGHAGAASPYDVSWAFGHPAKVEDLAWRAVHELAVTAKVVVANYYGKAPGRSYFNGCSDGGREGMKEAQAYPTDFNGILVGGTGAYWTRMANAQLVTTFNLARAGIQGDSGAAILRLAQAAAERACARVPNGAIGGVITDPRRCGFNPHALVCRAGQDPATCVTAGQADALAEDARPLRDVSGRLLFYGMPAGTEFDQIRFGYNRGPSPFGVGTYRVALGDPTWTPAGFDPRADLPRLDAALAALNAIDPDLSRFRAAGGKLIQYQGWGDAVALPEWTVHYYEQVVARTGRGSLAATQAFYRLFMQPGVGHCGTGPGPDNIGEEGFAPVAPDPEHDAVAALVRWVERGAPPERFVATRDAPAGVPDAGRRTQRPLCPHPQSAVWNGSGDLDRASSFRCERSAEAVPTSISFSETTAPARREHGSGAGE